MGRSEKMARGRPPKYEMYVKPRLEEIANWAKAGATNIEIAAALGIGKSTFCDYVNKYTELSDSLRTARMSGVPEIKLALYRRAQGFEYEERKTYIKTESDGNKTTYTEITTKYALPDVGAQQTYLRNNCMEFRDRDKATYDIKETELKLRELMAEKQVF